MFQIVILRKCILCGKETESLSGLCSQCLCGLPVIEKPSCAVCGSPLISEERICLRCRNTTYSFKKNISLYEYKGRAKDLIYLYKFENCRRISFFFAGMLYKKIEQEFKDYLIVPSPASGFKKRRKGWDQIEQICYHLKRDFHLPVLKVLGKKKSIGQKVLSLEERKKNLEGKIRFKIRYSSMIKGKKILIIDDVFTTGATLNECSFQLCKAGAETVSALTIASD